MGSIAGKPNCGSCPLKGHKHVWGWGDPKARIVIVGEAPGKEEEAAGYPFVGPSGKLLRRELEAVGFSNVAVTGAEGDPQTWERSGLYFTNVVKCNPGGPPPAGAIKACRSWLWQEIRSYPRDLLVAVGLVAATELLGRKATLAKDAGGIWQGRNGYKVLVVPHPSWVLRNGARGRPLQLFQESIHRLAEESGKVEREGKFNLVLVDSEKKFESMLDALEEAKLVAMDTETTGLDWTRFRVRGFSLATSAKDGWFVPLSAFSDATWPWSDRDAILSVLAIIQPKPVVFHNAKFDLHALWTASGVEPVFDRLHDSMLMAHVIDTSLQKGLKALCRAYVPEVGVYWDGYRGELDGVGAADVPPDVLWPYGAMDAVATWILSVRLRKMLASTPKRNRLYEELLLPLVWLYLRFERQGLRIDMEELSRLREHYQTEADKYLSVLRDEYGLDDPGKQQAFFAVFRQLNIDTGRRTATGKMAADADSLLALKGDKKLDERQSKFIDAILGWREVTKALSTYVEGIESVLGADGRLHPSIRIEGTRTGRLSSDHPNIMNWPRNGEVKRMIVADPGWELVGADYSQLELRVLAWASQDKKLEEAIRHKDLHYETARLIFGDFDVEKEKWKRSIGKAWNFAGFYGASPYGLAQQLNKAMILAGRSERFTPKQVEKMMDRVFRSYPGVVRFISTTRKEVARDGYVVTPYFGRVRTIPDVRASDRATREAGYRKAVNTKIQSAASDIAQQAIIIFADRVSELGLAARPLFTVHDELVVTAKAEVVDQTAEILTWAMKESGRRVGLDWLEVDLKRYGDRWH